MQIMQMSRDVVERIYQQLPDRSRFELLRLFPPPHVPLSLSLLPADGTRRDGRRKAGEAPLPALLVARETSANA